MRSTDNDETWHNGGDVVNPPYEKTYPGGIQGNDEPAIHVLKRHPALAPVAEAGSICNGTCIRISAVHSV